MKNNRLIKEARFNYMIQTRIYHEITEYTAITNYSSVQNWDLAGWGNEFGFRKEKSQKDGTEKMEGHMDKSVRETAFGEWRRVHKK